MDYFFLFKKLVSVVVMPLPLSLLGFLIALILLKAKPKFAHKLLFTSFLVLFTFSMPPVSDFLMHKLEDNYEAFTLSASKVDYIVVLGCGHETNDALAPTSQLKPCSLQRLAEGIRILKLHPEAKLITSGHSIADPSSNAEKVKQAAMALGVAEHKIITESFPKDTQEEAELISQRVKGSNVVLVTDAYHLPRAMGYFQMNGVNPIPAPAGFYVKNYHATKNSFYYLPTTKALQQSSIVWYEYMGQAHQLVQKWF